MAVQTTEEFKNGGATSYSITIEYLKTSDIKVRIGGALQTYVASSPSSGEYTVSGTTVTLGAQAAAGSGNVHIYRETDVNTAAATFAAGSSIRAADLNAIHDMGRFAAVEHRNKIITADIKEGQVTSTEILDGTIVNADVNASAAIAGTKISPDFGAQVVTTTGNIVVGGTVDGRDVAADGTKLDTVETNAKDDQTAAEIKSLYEGNSNTNAFTDAEQTKLSNIETAATADQTNAEIKTAYEANSNTNAYTDAEQTKLSGIETSATADQTGAEIKTAYEGESNTNAFTDAEKTKLSGIAASAEVNVNSDWNSSSGDSQILNKPTLVTSIDGLSDVDTTGVADNKILKYQASSSKFVIADDTGGGGGSSTFTGLSDSPTNYTGAAGKTVKVNAAGNGVEFVDQISDVVGDTTPQLGGNLDVQASEITTSTSNGNIKLNPNGTGVVEVKGDGSSADGTLQLNCSQNSHGVKIKSPAHSAGASYTLTLPTGISAGQVLTTDANGVLSWASVLGSAGGTVTGPLYAFGGIELGSNDTIKFDSDDSDTNHISFKGPSSLGSTVTYTLPEDGTNGQYLKTNGSGVLSFADVASTYNININTLSSSSGTGGGSATFNGTATRFTLSNAGTNAQAHIVSINGVVQKPNAGTSPSEGFAIDGNDIIFAAAPASGSDFFILTLGNAVSIGTPSDNTVTSAKIVDGTIVNADIAANAAIDASKISGLSTDKINEGDSKVEVVDSGSNGYVSTVVDGTEASRVLPSGNTIFTSAIFGSNTSKTDGSGQGISILYGGGTSNVGVISSTDTNGLVIKNNSAISFQQNGFPNNYYASFNNNGGSFSTGGTVRFNYDGTNINFALNVLPDTDSNYDIGTSAKRFANVYADTLYGDGSNLTGIASTTAGGAIYENSQTISATHTIPVGSNGMSAGPVTVNNGVTLTISTGSTYTIV